MPAWRRTTQRRLPARSGSSLADRTVERRASILPDACDRANAAGGRATLAFALVDAEARAAIALGVLQSNGAAKHRFDRLNQTFAAAPRRAASGDQRRRQTERRQACQMQRLARIDVADAG